MRRMTMGRAATAVVLLALSVTLALAQDSTPPGPGEEWQQENWSNASPPGLPKGPMRFGSGTGGQGSMSDPVDVQQHMREMQNRFQDMQRRAEESRISAIRQSLGVNDAQWARIKPRLDRIERLKAETNASIAPGSMNGGLNVVTGNGGSGGGWSGGFATSGGSSGPGQNWSRSATFGPGDSRTGRSGTGAPTQAETLCQELHNLLQNPSTPPAQIAQKVTALRQAKQQAQRDLERERTALRGLVNPQQEAALIVMGYLD